MHAARLIRVASWPGPEFAANGVIRLLSEGLEAAGARVLGVTDPAELADIPCDIIQIHWPEQIFWNGLGPKAAAIKACRTIAVLRGKKRSGVRLVWLVHNLAPHDMPRWQRLIWRYYASALSHLIDAYLTLSPSTVATVASHFPRLAKKPSHYIWHPAYPSVVRDKDTRRAAREALNISKSEFVFAYLGQVRRYKGVERLLVSFRGLTSQHVRLLIAGAVPEDALAGELRALAASDSRIVLVLRSLDDATFNAFMAAADEVVAPFEHYLHSGSIIHALSARKAVLTPATPFSQDLVDQFGRRWMRLYTPPLTTEILRASQHIETPSELGIDDVMSVHTAGETLLRLYCSLI